MTYFLSCEGETEHLYFDWLKEQINNDPRTRHKITFKYKNLMPSSFAKSNAGTFTKDMITGSVFCRIQDIEDYSDEHIAAFHSLLKSTKEAKRLYKTISFTIGYSNLTFEVWILAHKAKVREMGDRAYYYQEINSAYDTSFVNNDDYKHEKNFKSLLSKLTLDDVIHNAIPECKRFVEKCYRDNPTLQRQSYGVSYILANPDTTVHTFVESILKNAGIL